MNIKKYFWNLNEAALKETTSILKNPSHPKYPQRVVAILSRTNNPKEVFRFINRKQFVDSWPKIRKHWAKVGGSEDFRAWWETVYEEIADRAGKIPSADVTLAAVGAIIRDKRIERGWSQNDLAIKTGVDQPYISRIEKGVHLEVRTLIKICRALGIKNMPIPD